jgi:hypothetical protein
MTAEEFKRLAKAGQLPGQTLTPKNIPTATAPTATMTPLQQANSNRQMRNDIKTSVPGATTTADAMRTINSQNIAPTANVSNAITALGGTVNYANPKDTILANNNVSNIKEKPANTEIAQVPPVQIDDLKNISKEDKADFKKLNDFSTWLQDNITKNYQVPNANQGLQNSMQGYDKSIDGFRGDYSLENDPNYQAIADYNRRIMLQDAAKRGMALSDNTFAQIEQAQALLGRDFMNDEYARRQQDINNRYGQVGVYNNLNNQNYNMDMQGFNTAQGLEQQSYNRGIDTLNREIANYGFELTPQTRELMNVAQSMTPEQRQYSQQFEGNFAERMNQLDPSSQEYQMLNAARFNKILSNLASDPETFGQYLINDYGINPAVLGNLISQSREQNFQRELQTIGQYYDDFQQEINNRTEINPNDPLIPFLRIARAEKISGMKASELNQQQQLEKSAFDMFKELGYASGWIAEVLGLPEGTQSRQFLNEQGKLNIDLARLGLDQERENRMERQFQTDVALRERKYQDDLNKQEEIVQGMTANDRRDYDRLYTAINRFQTTPVYDDYDKVARYEVAPEQKNQIFNMLVQEMNNGTSEAVVNALANVFGLELVLDTDTMTFGPNRFIK